MYGGTWVLRKYLSDHCRQGESDSISHTHFFTNKYHSFFIFFFHITIFITFFKGPHVEHLFFDAVWSFPSKFCGTSSSFFKNYDDISLLKMFQRGCMSKWPFLMACYLLSCLLCNASFRTQFALIGLICFSKLFELHFTRIWLVEKWNDFAFCARWSAVALMLIVSPTEHNVLSKRFLDWHPFMRSQSPWILNVPTLEA